jgi:hypothetical protein
MAKAPTGKNGGNGGRTPTRKPTSITEGATKRPTAVAPASSRSEGDLQDEIRQRAYELYEQEGRQEGRDEEYWLRAEAEIRGRRADRSA